MATTITPQILTTRVSEEITLNGTNFNTTIDTTTSSINNYVNNLMRVYTGTQGIIEFSRTGVAARNTEYDIDNVKYIRLTNADDTNAITIVLNYDTSGNQSLKVAAGGSFILTDFTLASASDTLSSITVTCTADVDVPYVIGLD